MGNTDSKVEFPAAIAQLAARSQQIESNDESFWDQFWSDKIANVQDIFVLVSAAEIRSLREKSPSNLAILCNKLVDRLQQAAEHSCQTERDQIAAINCVRLLTRLLPYIFEESEWRGFFWSDIPNGQQQTTTSNGDYLSKPPLAQRLLQTLADLLFCPDFTVSAKKKKGPDNPEDIHTIDSCEYIWEAGVGCAHSPVHSPSNDRNRTEILKLLLTCFSETIYMKPSVELQSYSNKWLNYFTSSDNRQTLPLFTSLINIVFSYDPVGYLPYNYLLFTDTREPLVEAAAQLLCVTLDNSSSLLNEQIPSSSSSTSKMSIGDDGSNLFINYLSRIHRDDDFSVLLKGFCRLLNNPLIQTYLPGSCKKIGFYQELLILFWKFCDRNKKFLYYVLKSSEVLDVLVPILYFLNDARENSSKIGIMHIGIFILLLLSGERNFGVRLNKPYVTRVPMNIPVFTGTHADLLIIVFHKIIVSASQRIQPLYDCLLTIIVNISPYLKTLSMVSSNKLIHLLEAFSSSSFLFAASDNHHLVFFLLEAFNNLIQYQFDGNASLIYTIIRKRQIFFSLSNLPTDMPTIAKFSTKSSGSISSLKSSPDKSEKKRSLFQTHSKSNTDDESTSNGDKPQQSTTVISSMVTTLAETPSIHKMTERTLAASASLNSPPSQRSNTNHETSANSSQASSPATSNGDTISNHSYSIENGIWTPTSAWAQSWKGKLPLQTIMRLLQVLVPQVEKICMDRGLTDESEIIKFLQHGTLVGLLPIPHPILIRKYQPNSGTVMWFRTYTWGVIYLRNVDPPIWYDTDVKLFEIQQL
ncbi:unnamed protein product [Rotaria socialis]|uniref:HID1 n=1 Tax=Rotaria socialis TaxID=392032 RepID=A0A817SDX6_9BILA|nr:unnamed protein product [Rotaria socialis]CAF3341763.1 unnamed protein product [Rotaria socialis]CAF3394102.1 unnamed protein product [Rotaria socialis]CAF3678913.1 unnamed protein product [Rotaria socialis]CAF4178798.1 unnamed protein product [Rotaria socialis]